MTYTHAYIFTNTYINTYIHICTVHISKFGDCNRRQPEGSLFNSDYT